MWVFMVVVATDCGGGQKTRSCPQGQRRCGGSCVATADDPANCGASGSYGRVVMRRGMHHLNASNRVLSRV